MGPDWSRLVQRLGLFTTRPAAHVIGLDSCDGTCYWSWPAQTDSATRLDISLVLRRGVVADDREDPAETVKDGRGRNSRTAFPSAQRRATGTAGIAAIRQFQLHRFARLCGAGKLN